MQWEIMPQWQPLHIVADNGQVTLDPDVRTRDHADRRCHGQLAAHRSALPFVLLDERVLVRVRQRYQPPGPAPRYGGDGTRDRSTPGSPSGQHCDVRRLRMDVHAVAARRQPKQVDSLERVYQRPVVADDRSRGHRSLLLVEARRRRSSSRPLARSRSCKRCDHSMADVRTIQEGRSGYQFCRKRTIRRRPR